MTILLAYLWVTIKLLSSYNNLKLSLIFDDFSSYYISYFIFYPVIWACRFFFPIFYFSYYFTTKDSSYYFYLIELATSYEIFYWELIIKGKNSKLKAF